MGGGGGGCIWGGVGSVAGGAVLGAVWVCGACGWWPVSVVSEGGWGRVACGRAGAAREHYLLKERHAVGGYGGGVVAVSVETINH